MATARKKDEGVRQGTAVLAGNPAYIGTDEQYQSSAHGEQVPMDADPEEAPAVAAMEERAKEWEDSLPVGKVNRRGSVVDESKDSAAAYSRVAQERKAKEEADEADAKKR